MMKKEDLYEAEKELVRTLRYKEGLKYKDIATKLNKSLYWVHCRLSDKYKPNASRIEKHYQETEVVPYLIDRGHKIIREKTRTRCKEFSQEVDILSKKDGFTYVTEVKNVVNHHQLQTAIGQLILHRFGYKEAGNAIYQIVFPEKFANYRYFSQDFLGFLDKNLEIKVVFV